jgi:hypothetical protein
LKKNYSSSYKLPKQQSTNFWSQGILGVNSIFVIMNDLELFLLTGVLTQNFNIVDLVKFLDKNQKLHI